MVTPSTTSVSTGNEMVGIDLVRHLEQDAGFVPLPALRRVHRPGGVVAKAARRARRRFSASAFIQASTFRSAKRSSVSALPIPAPRLGPVRYARQSTA
jgi:hypothetical protein